MKWGGQQLIGLTDEARQRLIAESIADIKRALLLLPRNVKPEVCLTRQEWVVLLIRGMRSRLIAERNAAEKKQAERDAFVDRLMADPEAAARIMRKLTTGVQ